MKLQVKIALVTGVLALSAGPAFAAAHHDGSPPHGKGQAKGKGPTYTPAPPTSGPKDGLPAQAKAYGRYCQGESKKHVKGEKGTAFSRCVRNMAQAANQEHKSPGQVCKGESKKHVKGEKGTAFSRCVTAAAKLRKEMAEGDGS
jgi:hypothetical protein